MSAALLILFLCACVLIIAWWLTGAAKIAAPEFLEVRQIGRDNMADVLVYKVSVAPAVDADVVERRLTVVVNGLVVEGPKVFPASATDLGEVRAEQGASVLLTLVDVDDAGNRSEPASLEFVAEDTLPPAQPGALGVTLVAEIEGDVAAEPEAPSEEV